MTPIQMVDLKRQYQKIKPEVDAAMQEVLDNTAFIHGEPERDFALKLAEYLGVKKVIPCANGTDALQIALMALDLQPGDEIITPSFTFIATAEVIALLKLKPVFVDVDEKTFCLDTGQIEAAITPRTKAIIPVHLFGQSADMEPLMTLAKAHHLYVIEDNAQAIGGDYTFSDGIKKKTGAIGDIGCTSFFPSKNLGCFGDGGAVMTNDEGLAEKMRMIANHGQSQRYYHDLVGCNSRLDSLQAAVLNIKLEHLDAYLSARRKAAAFYTRSFSGHDDLQVPYQADNTRHVFHQYTLLVRNNRRDELHDYLAAKEIPSMIYYPVAAHRQKMFQGVADIPEHLPVTDRLVGEVLSLPMHSELDDDQLNFIASSVLDFFDTK
ncbi:MAG TPA: DegT/DnrJ/EryC1/StrS family aminotransferase [Chitinophagaceae bacterium]|nr:DegT/DnrJ/EryC1/StrS family aminotransferase [Chitinophagaceae bacterium]